MDGFPTAPARGLRRTVGPVVRTVCLITGRMHRGCPVYRADLPTNVPVEVAKYKALDLSPEVYDQVMGGTAIETFKLKW